MNCAICSTRKPRRVCPGVSGEICTLCCAREREESIDCPLTCEYLRAGHDHERAATPPPETLPDGDVEVEEDFFERYEFLLILFGSAIVEAYRAQPAITDLDVRDALEFLVKTWKTRESGLVYESLPVNPYALAIFESVEASVAALRQRVAEAGQTSQLPDSVVTKILMFLRRMEFLDNNGRKRGRAFLDVLNRSYFAMPAPGAKPAEPDEPRIIL